MNLPDSPFAGSSNSDPQNPGSISFSKCQLPTKSDVTKITVILLLVVVNGCATSPPALPINDPDERLQFNGFSALPPRGTGWHWVGREGQDRGRFLNTTFVKKDGDSTYVAAAGLVDTEGKDLSHVEQLLLYVKSAKTFQEGPRQENMASTFKIDHTLGRPCVRYDLDGEDFRVPGRPGVGFSFDGHGLVCTHPTATGLVAWIFYSRRSPKGVPHVGGTDEGEHFLANFQFSDVNR